MSDNEMFISKVAGKIEGYAEKDRKAQRQVLKEVKKMAKQMGGGLGTLALEICSAVRRGEFKIDVNAPDIGPRELAEGVAKMEMAYGVEMVEGGLVPEEDIVYIVVAPVEGEDHVEVVTLRLAGEQAGREAQALGLATMWGLSAWQKALAIAIRSTDASVKLGDEGSTAGFEGTIRMSYAWPDDEGGIQYRRLERQVSRDSGNMVEIGKMEFESNADDRNSALLRSMFRLNSLAEHHLTNTKP